MNRVLTKKEVFEQAPQLHYELWDWLAKNPTDGGTFTGKEGWPRWSFNGGNISIVFGLCFACEVTEKNEPFRNCSKCPCDWGAANCQCGCSPFRRWEESKTKEERSKYALLVRDAWIRKD